MDKWDDLIRDICQKVKRGTWEIGTTLLFVVLLVKFLLYELGR